MQGFLAASDYERDLGRVSSQVEHMLHLGRTLVAGVRPQHNEDVAEIKIENENIRLRWEVSVLFVPAIKLISP